MARQPQPQPQQPRRWWSGARTLSSSPSVRRWSVLSLIVVWMPLATTYFQVHRWMAAEQCVVMVDDRDGDGGDAGAEAGGDIFCWGRKRNGFLLSSSSSLSPRGPPPSIAGLVTLLSNAGDGRPPPRITVTETTSIVYNYAEESPLGGARFGSSSHPGVSDGGTTTDNNDNNNDNSSPLGFRRNPNKRTSSSFWGGGGGAMTTATATTTAPPTATYFWLFLNVGLYLWYRHAGVDPGTVSVGGEMLVGRSSSSSSSSSSCCGTGDFGRALSGQVSHFEIYHLGFNAVSLVTLGEALESSSLGGPGLHLWTASCLPLVAVGVVVLRAVDLRFGPVLWRRVLRRQQRRTPPGRFPAGVGFSGVLFAWSTRYTLSLPEHRVVCPIPLLSSVCFSTHTLGGSGFRFSWGPIVQLVAIQLLLNRRVSFAGHLSGLIVGFLWYWEVLPPLGVSQPSVLYPLLWMAGKSALFRWGGFARTLAGRGDGDDGDGEGLPLFGSGVSLGGGVVGNSGGGRWTGSPATDDDADDAVPLLRALLWLSAVHWVATLKTFGRAGLEDGTVPGELLLLVMLALLVRAVDGAAAPGGGGGGHRRHPLADSGLLGRAYVALVPVAIATDAMGVGGWWAASVFSAGGWRIPLLLLATRCLLWASSAAVTCFLLGCSGGLERPSSSSSGGGIWGHVLGRSVAEPGAALGRALVRTVFPRASGAAISTTTTTTAAAAATGSVVPEASTTASTSSSQGGKGSGRSASNLAGKSRLVA